MRDGVSYLLNAQPDMKVVGGAQTAWQAVQLSLQEQPDVAIVADASQICTTLIQELKRRIRS